MSTNRDGMTEAPPASVAANSEAVHECEVCGDIFESQPALDGHRRWHDEIGPDPEDLTETCDKCDAAFETEAQLQGHQAAHAPEGGYPDRVPLTAHIAPEARHAAPLKGFIPRVEAQRAHHDFLWAVRPPAAMLGIERSRQLVKRGETADSYFPPETTVITTTTINDRKLHQIPVHRAAADDETVWTEEEIVWAFRPDAHLPADFPTYGDDPPDVRETNARRCAEGMLYMARNTPPEVSIIPLIKGTTAAERRPCEVAAGIINTGIAAVYVQQHYSVGGGGGEGAARDLVRSIINETDGQFPLLLVGAGSPHTVGKYPEAVVATAAQRTWREPVAPRTNAPGQMRDHYTSVDAGVAGALSDGPQYDRGSAAKRSAEKLPGEGYCERFRHEPPELPSDTADWHDDDLPWDTDPSSQMQTGAETDAVGRFQLQTDSGGR